MARAASNWELSLAASRVMSPRCTVRSDADRATYSRTERQFALHAGADGAKWLSVTMAMRMGLAPVGGGAVASPQPPYFTTRLVDEGDGLFDSLTPH
jgi:hypothetical protein